MALKVHLNEFLRTLASRGPLSSSPSMLPAFTSSYHMIILNSPSLDLHASKKLWNVCKTVVCADGGANRLFDNIGVIDRPKFIPHFITGDLDSLREDVSKYYE